MDTQDINTSPADSDMPISTEEQEPRKEDETENKPSSFVKVLDTADTPKKIELNVEFSSFIELRNALEKYQTENHVQLIVKDSKLLNAESTRKIIPKVYHLVNKNLMYHSITYCCKCHGELKQKPKTRIKNVGAKRLNCPVYLRFKLTSDLQSLVLFDIYELHNHAIDPNTFQLPPRQQVYNLSRMKRGQLDMAIDHNRAERKEVITKTADVHALIAAAIKDVNSVSSLSQAKFEPLSKSMRLDNSRLENIPPGGNRSSVSLTNKSKEKQRQSDSNDDYDDDGSGGDDCNVYHDNPNSPLDPESSCSDSDEEEFRTQRHLLPYPVRLIGSAIQSSPELTTAAKELIDIQKGNLILEKRKLMLQTKQLELENAKLALEVKIMEKNLAAEMVTPHGQDTTIYLQA